MDSRVVVSNGRCKSTFVRTQVAWMGTKAYTMEEFWMKYGHHKLFDREALFRFFFFFRIKHSGAFMSRTEVCMGGMGHALSICLDSCGIGVW